MEKMRKSRAAASGLGQARDVSMGRLRMMQGRVKRDLQSADKVNGSIKTTTM